MQLTVNMPEGWELLGVSPGAPGWAVVRNNHDSWLVDMQAEGDHIDFGKHHRLDLGLSTYETNKTKSERKTRVILSGLSRAEITQWRNNLLISLGGVMMIVDVSGKPRALLAADIDRSGILDFDFAVTPPR